MDGQSFRIEIRPAEAAQLDLLESTFDPDSLSRDHYRRYEKQQRGDGIYLIAWHDQTPVGHFLLLWSGPHDAAVMDAIDITNSAYLEAGATLGRYQRRGVATAIIQEAERLAKARGCTHIGLEVGSTDNPDAKRLYTKMGYVDWGGGEFLIQWEYHDKNGQQGIETEMVTYLRKSLV